jgi:superfamily I DNA/RNA helicase
MNDLSREQEDAIGQKGRFVLWACPGSGKTFTVAHRLAYRLEDWSQPRCGIATLSFTNVAHEEISSQLQKLGCLAIPPYPHYLGTIDSFINNWIFLPFGHLVMECPCRPSIVGTAHNPWQPRGHAWAWRSHECNANQCNLVDFTYDRRGELINLTGERTGCPQNRRPCAELKKKFVSQGYATQADANYWAMKILEIYPKVSRVLARRFPEMIIDEAQDTSEIQMYIIDLLIKNGLSEIMLVGDPDQAIYEWRDAKPKVFEDKASAEFWEAPLYLTQNWRSSRWICKATVGFSKKLSEPSEAVGPDANFEARPTIFEYNPENFGSLPEEFVTRCQNYGIELGIERTAILVRTRRILRKILDAEKTEVDPWKHEATHLLAQAAYYFQERQEPNRAMQCMFTVFSWLCFGDRFPSTLELERKVDAAMGSREWRAGIWQCLKRMPEVSRSLLDWVTKTKAEFNAFLEERDWPVADETVLNLKVKNWVGSRREKSFLNWSVSAFFTESSCQVGEITIETVHAAKGKTYEAVLFVVSDQASKSGTAAQLGKRPIDDEEIRTAYVAMTRPRKLLLVAVPKGTDTKYLKRFPDFMKTELNAAQLTFL